MGFFSIVPSHQNLHWYIISLKLNLLLFVCSSYISDPCQFQMAVCLFVLTCTSKYKEFCVVDFGMYSSLFELSVANNPNNDNKKNYPSIHSFSFALLGEWSEQKEREIWQDNFFFICMMINLLLQNLFFNPSWVQEFVSQYPSLRGYLIQKSLSLSS